MNPKVTVLMSVFNGRTYLPEAVESILGQTFGDFEFLIIDDGSEQPLEDTIRSYKDSRTSVYRQENMGLARSLNRGLGLARGDYVARMDADDVSRLDRLQMQFAEMESHPQIDLLGAFFDVIDDNGELIETKELITDPIYRLWRLQFHNTYGHGTVMLRRQSVIDAGMYDESLLYAQDYELWSRISAKENTAIIPEVLYHYRLFDKSQQASVRNYDAQLTAAIYISDRNLRACNANLSDEDRMQVRALYWKFQIDHIGLGGLKALPDTFEGFCRRYEINATEKRDLIERVTQDAITEMAKSNLIPIGDKQRVIHELELLRS
ncbi:MAG TPA: glycosyltransferase [Desulfomonilaceae bacterium]|nr:glycosyltransferase [Desulfomonilaceae bacterium]